jgi:hypothetical protein
VRRRALRTRGGGAQAQGPAVLAVSAASMRDGGVETRRRMGGGGGPGRRGWGSVEVAGERGEGGEDGWDGASASSDAVEGWGKEDLSRKWRLLGYRG